MDLLESGLLAYPQLRRLMLYPVELRAHVGKCTSFSPGRPAAGEGEPQLFVADSLITQAKRWQGERMVNNG